MYTVIGLKELYKESEEEKYKKDIRKIFGSDINGDTETQKFLFEDAFKYEFDSKARTYLIYNDKDQLVGYFALSGNKLTQSTYISNKIGKMLDGIKIKCSEGKDKSFVFSSILLGQLSRNNKFFSHKDIPGDDLLKCAIAKIKESYNVVGGKCVTVDCVEKLLPFYAKYNFTKIDKKNDLYRLYILTKTLFGE